MRVLGYRRLLGKLCVPCAIGVAAGGGCGGADVPSPFQAHGDAGVDASADGDAGGDAPGGDATDLPDSPGSDPTLGNPCVDDGQCDDEIPCTFDRCDLELGRCRHLPDDSVCLDGVFCDGLERCDVKLGCREGEPVSCSDGNTCTIDRCQEETQICEHRPRDADGDGDPDRACGGEDCDDSNPFVSGALAVEICDNQVDDDCDEEIDEEACSAPLYDVCIDPLPIEVPGNYVVSTRAAAADYSASCAAPGQRDIVAAIVVDGADPIDVDVRATTAQTGLTLAAAQLCGDAASELACANGTSSPVSNYLARLRLRGVGPGNYPLYLFSNAASDIELAVDFLPATAAPTNETCGTAAALEVGELALASVLSVDADLISECGLSQGELVYRFAVPATSDIQAVATSVDGVGLPILSLRGGACVDPASELDCRIAPTAEVFARAVEPGTYYLAVSATAPTEVEVVVELEAPSAPPADEDCSGAPAIAVGETTQVSLGSHLDDVSSGCLIGAVDAAYTLSLTERSDLLLVERVSSQDTGAVGLATPGCSSDDVLACASGATVVRAQLHDVAPGEYRVFAESARAAPVSLTPLVRPAVPPAVVAFADTCQEAIEIGPTGGFFQGNTANARGDYDAGCDFGGQFDGGAADQMLRFVLTEARRVVLDMQGSDYTTLLNVRRGPECPGSEIAQGCGVGFSSSRTYLDLVLEAGEYFVQIDGYNGQSGPWFLDVYFTAP